MSNNVFTTSLDILKRINLDHPNKQTSIAQIENWCIRCERDILGVNNLDDMPYYEGLEIAVNNRIASLPSSVLRIMDVYTNPDSKDTSYIDFFVGMQPTPSIAAYTGESIILPQDNTSNPIYINYYGLHYNDDGYVMLLREHDLALQAYCVYMLYWEDMANGKISQLMAQDIIMTKNHEMAAATYTKQTNKSKQYYMNLMKIRGNMMPRIGGYPQ